MQYSHRGKVSEAQFHHAANHVWNKRNEAYKGAKKAPKHAAKGAQFYFARHIDFISPGPLTYHHLKKNGYGKQKSFGYAAALAGATYAPARIAVAAGVNKRKVSIAYGATNVAAGVGRNAFLYQQRKAR